MPERASIRSFIERLLAQQGDKAPFMDSDSLTGSGRLQSIDVLELVVFLEDKYGVDFAKIGFDINELDSVDHIAELIAANCG